MNPLFRILVAISFLLLGDYGFVHATSQTGNDADNAVKIFAGAVEAGSDAAKNASSTEAHYNAAISDKDYEQVDMPEVEDESDESVFVKKLSERNDYFAAFYDHGGSFAAAEKGQRLPQEQACLCAATHRYILYRVFRI